MHTAHDKLGVKWKGSRKGSYEARTILARADTGCQTCTAGPDFLNSMNCMNYPKEYLDPTSIKGITDKSLGITGAMFVCMEIGGKVT